MTISTRRKKWPAHVFNYSVKWRTLPMSKQDMPSIHIWSYPCWHAAALSNQPLPRHSWTVFCSINHHTKAMLPNESQPTSIHIYLKCKCVNMVKKCLNKEFASDIFDNYFEMNDRSMNTRNNKHCIRLPPVKLEVARCGFYFTGSTLYNSLPINIRKIDSIDIFKEKVSEFFK